MKDDLLYTILGLGVLCLLSFYLIFRYSGHFVSRPIFYISWAIWSASLTYFIILPADIYINNRKGIDSEIKNRLIFVWRISYWSLVSVTSLLLPYLKAFEASGEFTLRKKLIGALQMMIFWYVLYIAVGIIGIYLLFKFGVTTSISELEGFLMAILNTFGLYLLIITLGFGAIEIPKQLIKYSKPAVKQLFLEHHVSYLDSKLEDIYYQLENEIKVLRKLQEDPKASQFKHEISSLLDMVPSKLKKVFLDDKDSYLPTELVEDTLKVVTINQS